MTASDQVIDILRKAEVKKFWEKSGFSPY